MDNDLFTVALRFDDRNNGMREKIQACLAQVKGVSPERLATLLNTGRLVVQRNADPAQARRLKELLEATGARCQLIRQSRQPHPEPYAAISGPAPTPAEVAATNTMTCPQCGLAQPALPECRACGIIIVKARLRPVIPTGEAETAVLEKLTPQVSGQAHVWRWLRRQLLPKIWAWLCGQRLGKASLHRWSQKLSDALSRCALVFILTLILETGLLYLSRAMWFIYTHTPMGQYYLTRMGDEAEAIQNVMEVDTWLIGWRVTLLAFLVCLGAGSILRVTHLMRYFYQPQGMVGRLLLWCLPMTAGMGWLASRQDPWPPYTVACMLTAAPTFCLLSTCFNLTEVMLPEAGEVLKRGLKTLPGAGSSLSAMSNKLHLWLDLLRKTD